MSLPIEGSPIGVVLSSDGNPRYGELDPYWGGANAVVEAVRNVVVTGVHTNTCVLGRPFAIRQMVRQGQSVVLVRDLTDTMLDAPGVGLAAPQLGVSLRVFTYHVDDVVGHLVNPELRLSSEQQDGPEGCLSLPGLEFDCLRAQDVVAIGQNMYGDPVTIEGSDLLARCIQHETDHLDGVLFIDRLDPRTRKAAMEALAKSTPGSTTANSSPP